MGSLREFTSLLHYMGLSYTWVL
uniref:Uncharacterized protein n=1 Tax=Arundo donax TaxID=35708 RepID=A0A0A9EEK3_ARUDO